MEDVPRHRYALEIHARRSVCECGHAFTLKREAHITASSHVKRKSLRVSGRYIAETRK